MLVLDRIKECAKTNAPALRSRDECLSYAELDARSDSFAAWLLDSFGDSRSPVLIYGHKEPDFLPCIFGSLKAGRAYVPVDTATPPGRVAEIIADSQPGVIVDFSGTLSPVATIADRNVLRKILQAPAGREVARDCWVSGDDTAYILFTSGSTGRPKGVPITAANLHCFLDGILPFMRGDEGGVVLNQVSYSFDVSCCSIYAGLCLGMELLTVDRDMMEDLGALFKWIEASRLNVWVSTPSFAELCARSKAFSRDLAPELRLFLFCGEVLTHKLCDRLAERFPQVRVLNTYGPTEATVLVTAAWVTEQTRRDPRPIPIGRPVGDTELRLAGECGTSVESDGVPGELLILGGSVGTGYHRNPALSAERFFLDAQTGKRGYRTGDICVRYDGLYYYQGRADNQLKISGYRVEIEDIESNLTRVENVSVAAVIPVREDGRVSYLAAFLLSEGEDGLTPFKRSIEVRKRAREFLPAYMIPRKLIWVDSFPLTASGKIDKKTLERRLREADAQ